MPDRRDSGGPSILGVDRRKALVTAGVAAFLGLASATLVARVADWQEVLERLGRAEPTWLALAVAALPLAYAGYVLAYRVVARSFGGPALGYWISTKVVVLGLGAGVLGSSPSGLAVDLWALHRAGLGLHEAARRVIGLHTLRWAVLGVFAATAGAVLLVTDGVPLGLALGWVVAVPLAVAGVIGLDTAGLARRIAPPRGSEPDERGRSVRRWAAWLLVKARRGASDALGSIAFVRGLVAHPRRHRGLVGFALFWAGDLVVLFAALRAFDHAPGAGALVLAYATAHVVKSVPLPAGGAGIAEAALASTLALVGVPLSAAILAAFAYRVVSFWVPVAIALALLPVLGSLPGELDELDRGPASARSSRGEGSRRPPSPRGRR